LSRNEFNTCFRARFADTAFADKQILIDQLMETAWDGYQKARKSPATQKAGPEFADPAYDLSVDWLATRNAIRDAQKRHDDAGRPVRVLLICRAASETGATTLLLIG
jgi:23S rRNA A2030 N6-methylase RlmJ